MSQELIEELDAFFRLPYQREWMVDRSSARIFEKSRQVGCSDTMAMEIASLRMSGRVKRPAYYISADKDSGIEQFQSKTFAYAERWNRVLELMGKPPIPIKNEKRGKLIINGVPVFFMACNPSALHGKSVADFYVDEFTLAEKHGAGTMHRLWEAIKPAIMWGGTITIFATHTDRNNFYTKLIDMGKRWADGCPRDEDTKISYHRVSVIDALNSGLLVRLNRRRRSEGQEEFESRDEFLKSCWNDCGGNRAMFARAYLASVEGDEEHYLKEEEIRAAQLPQLLDPLEAEGYLYGGWDFGVSNSASAFVLIENNGGVYRPRVFQHMMDEDDETQIEIVSGWMDRYQDKVVRVICDYAGKWGKHAFDTLKLKHPGRFFECAMTEKVKERIAGRMKALLGAKWDIEGEYLGTGRRLYLPPGENVFHDFHNVSMRVNERGVLEFDAPYTDYGHSDDFWAMALAVDGSPDGYEGWEDQRDADWRSRMEPPGITVHGVT